MKPMFITLALCLIAASASACPNLSGHYVLQGEDGVVQYTVRQRGCDRVEIDRTSTYLGKASAVETQVFIVDGKPHGKTGTVNHWVGNRLQIGPTENHVYYGLDSSRNLLMSDGRSYPQCNGPCDEVATAQAPPPHRIHVKEDVEKAKLIHTVYPVYPPANNKRMDGTVVLHVIIGKDGAVNSVRYVSGPANLMDSAVNAVLQWRYKPTLMNGVPVEVDTTVSVVFPPPTKVATPFANK